VDPTVVRTETVRFQAECHTRRPNLALVFNVHFVMLQLSFLLSVHILSTVGSRPAVSEDVAEHARRVTRAEEQMVRSARTVYALSQQVMQFQDELSRVNLRSVEESRKVFYVHCCNSVHLCQLSFWYCRLVTSLLYFSWTKHYGIISMGSPSVAIECNPRKTLSGFVFRKLYSGIMLYSLR